MPVGPFGGDVYSGVTHQGALLVGTRAGVYRSDDGGATFRAQSRGMPSGAILDLHDASGVLLACIQDRGIYRSTDGGATWSLSKAGPFLEPYSPITFEQAGTAIFVRQYDANVIHYTSDTGMTWNVRAITNSIFNRVCGAGSNLFTVSSTLGASNGLYRSGNLGQSWMHTGIGGTNELACVRKLGNTVYALGELVYASTNDGVSWQQATSATLSNPLYVANNFYPAWFASDGTNVYAQNGGNAALLVARWKAGDASWIAQSNGVPTAGNMLKFFMHGSRVFLSRAGHRFRTDGPGQAWTAASSTGINGVVISDLFAATNGATAVNATQYLAAVETSAVWIATNPAAIHDLFTITRTAQLGTNALIGAQDAFGIHDFFHSANQGATWTAKYISNLEGASRWLVLSNAVIVCGHDANTGQLGAELVTAGGALVTNLSAGLFGLTFDEDFPDLTLHGTNLFAVTKGLYNPISQILRRPLTATGTVFWAMVTNSFNGSLFGAAAIGSWQGGLYLGMITGGGVRVSSNNAGSWATLNGGLTNVSPTRFVSAGNKLLMASDAGLFLHRGGTGNWENLSFNLPASDIANVQVSPRSVWVQLRQGGVWRMSASELELRPLFSGIARAATATQIVVTWAAVSGLTYRVEAGNLQGGWAPLATGLAAAAGGLTSYTNASSPAASNALLYRVLRE